MQTYAFDSHAYVKRLIGVGFSEQQAEVLAEERARIVEHLSTKQDISDIQQNLLDMESRLKQNAREMEDRLKHDAQEREDRLKHDAQEMEDRLKHDAQEREDRLQLQMREMEARLKYDAQEREINLRKEMSTQRVELLKWAVAISAGHAAFVIAVLKFI